MAAHLVSSPVNIVLRDSPVALTRPKGKPRACKTLPSTWKSTLYLVVSKDWDALNLPRDLKFGPAMGFSNNVGRCVFDNTQKGQTPSGQQNLCRCVVEYSSCVELVIRLKSRWDTVEALDFGNVTENTTQPVYSIATIGSVITHHPQQQFQKDNANHALLRLASGCDALYNSSSEVDERQLVYHLTTFPLAPFADY
ncbi:hypothetical protein HG530_015019 [Fusarium avenaceum]|nr:hypothetical protein HG530_015019 [Fusarium avenaceum]